MRLTMWGKSKGREGARRGKRDRFMKIGLLACNRDCNTVNNIVLGIGWLHKLSLRDITVANILNDYFNTDVSVSQMSFGWYLKEVTHLKEQIPCIIKAEGTSSKKYLMYLCFCVLLCLCLFFVFYQYFDPRETAKTKWKSETILVQKVKSCSNRGKERKGVQLMQIKEPWSTWKIVWVRSSIESIVQIFEWPFLWKRKKWLSSNFFKVLYSWPCFLPESAN